MFNPFPELLSLSFFAPFLLRVIVGLLILRLGALHLTRNRESVEKKFAQVGLRPGRIFARVSGLIEVVGAILLVLGLFTQVTALVLAIGFTGVLTWGAPFSERYQRSFYILLITVLLTLLLLGAGAFAFDIPL